MNKILIKALALAVDLSAAAALDSRGILTNYRVELVDVWGRLYITGFISPGWIIGLADGMNLVYI